MSVEAKLGKSLYGRRWRKTRLLHLQAKPLCRYCLDQGLIVPATVVDHVVRHAGHADPLFWDTGNLQSLCKRCHDSIKAQLDEKGWARGFDAQGLPLYPDARRFDARRSQDAENKK